MAFQVLTTEESECLLCKRKSIDELKFGPLIRKNDIVIHYYCLLFSSAEQNGKDDEGILGFLESDIADSVRLVETNKCCYCSESNAASRCSKTNCPAVFHYPCGLENGSMHRFQGRFNSFCFAHRPRQRVLREFYLQARQNPPNCLICLESVDCDNVIDAIWASCCRFTWYHRNCIQRFALSSGWLLKCVACRDRTKFRSLLQRIGIYVPKRDASWETTPGAFAELYTRRKECITSECKCPSGRTHEDDREWELTLCRLCGSHCVHLACVNLTEEEWECEICSGVH